VKALLRDIKSDWVHAGHAYTVPAHERDVYAFEPRFWFRVVRFLPRFLTTLIMRSWFIARYQAAELWEYEND